MASATLNEAPFRFPYFTDEHERIRQKVRQFCEQEIAPFAEAWDQAGEFPRELFNQAGELVPRPGPLSDPPDGFVVDVDDQGLARPPRPRPEPFVSVKFPVAEARQRSVWDRVGDQDGGQPEQPRHDPCPCQAMPQRCGAGGTQTGYAHHSWGPTGAGGRHSRD